MMRSQQQQQQQKFDPKLTQFKRAASTENFTEEIMDAVTTDNEHHCVKDLVRMIEKNTKSESDNAYVRKWGCDLISPEPHSKDVTYRRERREFQELARAKRQQQQAINNADINGNYDKRS